MSVRNHPRYGIATTSQCAGGGYPHVPRKGHDGNHANFDPEYYHHLSLQHTSGYPFAHVNHYPTTTTAAGPMDAYMKPMETALSYLNPMDGPFDPSGMIMQNTIGEPSATSGTREGYVVYVLYQLVKLGFNMVIAKRILDAATSMSLRLLNSYGKVDREALQKALLAANIPLDRIRGLFR